MLLRYKSVLFLTVFIGALASHADTSKPLPSSKLEYLSWVDGSCEIATDVEIKWVIRRNTIAKSIGADRCELLKQKLNQAKLAHKSIILNTDIDGNLVNISEDPGQAKAESVGKTAASILINLESLKYCKFIADENGRSFDQKNCGSTSLQVRSMECIDPAVGRVTFQTACIVSGKEISADDCIAQRGTVVNVTAQPNSVVAPAEQGGVR